MRFTSPSYLFFILVPLLLSSCEGCRKIEHLNGSDIRKNDLSDRISSLMDSAGVTGLAISIFEKGEPVYQHAWGYARLEEKEELTPYHVFNAASLGKAVFAYLTVQLVQDGTLDLDTPLQNYLDTLIPDYPVSDKKMGYSALKADERYKKITARMCLAHTTGFPDWRWQDENNAPLPAGEIRFLFDPGQRFSYSGEGFCFLQFVIEKMTGRTLEDLASEKVFRPLQMNSTSYVWKSRFNGRHCVGHDHHPDTVHLNKKYAANAANSLITSLHDYTRFTGELLKLASSRSETTRMLFWPQVRILSKSQFGREAQEFTTENDSIRLAYGLGWGLLQSPYGYAAFKEGQDPGFRHYSLLFPETGKGVIIFSNSSHTSRIFRDLMEISIGDSHTPWNWHQYNQYDPKP